MTSSAHEQTSEALACDDVDEVCGECEEAECEDGNQPNANRTRRTDTDLVLREHAREMFETQLRCRRIVTADDGRQRHRRRKRGDG